MFRIFYTGRKKKAPAPPPPSTSKSLLSLKEEDVVSEHIPAPVAAEAVSKSQTLPATAKISHDAEPPCSNSRLQNTAPEPVSSCTVDSCSVEQPPPVDVDSVVSTKAEPGKTRSQNRTLLTTKSGKCILFPLMSVLNEEDVSDCTLRRRRRLLSWDSSVEAHEAQGNSTENTTDACGYPPECTETYVSKNNKMYEIKRKSEPVRTQSSVKKNCVLKIDETNSNQLNPVPVPRIRKNSCPVVPFTTPFKINNLEVESGSAKGDDQKSLKDEVSSEENENAENNSPGLIIKPELPCKLKLIEKSNRRDKLFDEICNFRINKSGDDPLGDYYDTSKSYVQRRRSEIEARIRSNLVDGEVIPQTRKYSEGSLTFSKIPPSFLFPKDNRHVIFDSKNLQKEENTGQEINAPPPAADQYDFNISLTPSNEIEGKTPPKAVDTDTTFLEHLNSLLSKKFEDYV